MATLERIQKVLARMGLGSRRHIEEWIRQGRVVVNDKTAELGMRISNQDKLFLDGKLVNIPNQLHTRVLIYHKPIGEICSHSDPQGRPTIYNRLPPLQSGKWISVGRLDINTAGLQLVTNNGDLANYLMHPSNEIEREYAVRVLGDVTERILSALLKGVILEDGPAKFDSIHFSGGAGANTWYHVTLHEGRHREVRRIWEAVDLTVSRLLRVRFGPITLPRDLPSGQWQELTAEEIKLLKPR